MASDPQDRPAAEDVDVVQAVAGDEQALARLLHGAAPRLRRTLRIAPRWKRSLDIEDVLQVTFSEAAQRITALENATMPSFRQWLQRIAENNLRDALRFLERDKRPAAGRRETQWRGGVSSRTFLGRFSREAPAAGTQLAQSEEVERLKLAVQELPPDQRDVVMALDIEGRSVTEVAQQFERTPGAIHMLRSRALARLRERFQGSAEELDRGNKDS